MMNFKPSFILNTGDLVANGKDPAGWKAYDAITGDMRRQVPVYTARGNHDLGGPGYEERMSAPIASGNRLYYSFSQSNCHVIALDCFSPLEQGTAQYEWLVKDLKESQDKFQHIFVFFHEPPYSIGLHGSNLKLRDLLCPLFKRYGVRAVFTGHDHIYYRTIRDDIPYIVTGGGGAPLYPCDGAKAQPGDKWESVHNFVVVQVSGPRVTFTAIRSNGTILDQLTVRAHNHN
jgi:3',5'-cyclic AMP phosphodiesterase CpdA